MTDAIRRVARAICCPGGCTRVKCNASDQDPESGWLFVHPYTSAVAAMAVMGGGWLDVAQSPPVLPKGCHQLKCYVSWYGAATGRQALYSNYADPQWTYYDPDTDRYFEEPELGCPDIWFPIPHIPRSKEELASSQSAKDEWMPLPNPPEDP